MPDDGGRDLFKGLYELLYSDYRTSIQVYEWKEDRIRSARLPNSPDFYKLTSKRPDLYFSGPELAHAVVQADYLVHTNPERPSLGFLLQADDIIDFASPTIQLRSGASRALADVSKSSMSGRVAQGLSILYGHSLGLKFVSHLLSHVESLPTNSKAFKHKKNKMADFLFSDNNKAILIESKGSFSLEVNDPSLIKGMLKQSLLKQIDPWMKHLTPTPSNGYVVYSCLREGGCDKSAIFVVDPEGEDSDQSEVFYDIERIIRENYGGWLRAMGLGDIASRLLSLSTDVGEPSEHIFFIAELEGRKFAYPHMHMRPWTSPWMGPLAGIDLHVLKAIAEVLQFREQRLEDLLLDYVALRVTEDGLFSVFPDGSIFGPSSAIIVDRVSMIL